MVLENMDPVFENTWKDVFLLHRYIDIRNEIAYSFFYSSELAPERVRVERNCLLF